PTVLKGCGMVQRQPGGGRRHDRGRYLSFGFLLTLTPPRTSLCHALHAGVAEGWDCAKGRRLPWLRDTGSSALRLTMSFQPCAARAHTRPLARGRVCGAGRVLVHHAEHGWVLHALFLPAVLLPGLGAGLCPYLLPALWGATGQSVRQRGELVSPPLQLGVLLQ